MFVSYDSEELANTLSYKLAPCSKHSKKVRTNTDIEIVPKKEEILIFL